MYKPGDPPLDRAAIIREADPGRHRDDRGVESLTAKMVRGVRAGLGAQSAASTSAFSTTSTRSTLQGIEGDRGL